MFIKSNHPFEVEITGVLLPKRKYSLDESNYGKRTFVEVSDEQLDRLKQDGVFQSLLNTKQYEILKDVPSSLIAPSDRVRQLEKKQSERTEELNNLKKEASKVNKENEELRKELSEVIKEKLDLQKKLSSRGKREDK